VPDLPDLAGGFTMVKHPVLTLAGGFTMVKHPVLTG
jgi:hypothetical protein